MFKRKIINNDHLLQTGYTFIFFLFVTNKAKFKCKLCMELR